MMIHDNSSKGVNNLIKFAVNHWRVMPREEGRVIKSSDIIRYMNENDKVNQELPKCP